MASMRDLAKHSSIYALGQLLCRFASVLVLPLYTHYLTPADYGVISILEVTTTVLAMVIGAGMTHAVTRYHFDAGSDDERRRVWWTGLCYVIGMAGIVVLPMWLSRDWLAELTLGSAVENGGRLYTLALATLGTMTVGEVLDAYIRVQKWSGRYLALSFGKLCLNLGLNVWLLVGCGWGVTGQLTGNLIANVASVAVMLAIFRSHVGPIAMSSPLLTKLLRFGAPLIVQAFLSLLMHEADRFFLLAYVTMDDIGVYALAYKIGQAVNSLCLMPFFSVWSVALYEIAKQPDAKRQYAQVFQFYVSALGIVMLGVSLSATPLLPFLTTDAFEGSISLLPIILLAFVFFSLHTQFNVPALLAKKTVHLLPAPLAAVIVNLALNAWLVPLWGATGAAWVSVATYGTYSFAGLWLYRRIDVIPYRFGTAVLTLSGLAATYLVLHYALLPHLVAWEQVVVAITACLVWTGLLFGRVAWQWMAARRRTRELAI